MPSEWQLIPESILSVFYLIFLHIDCYTVHVLCCKMTPISPPLVSQVFWGFFKKMFQRKFIGLSATVMPRGYSNLLVVLLINKKITFPKGVIFVLQ